MAVVIDKLYSSLIKPLSDMPSVTLDLSPIDRTPFLRLNMKTLIVYRHGPGAANVFKEALSIALVPYYPLSGRLKESVSGELQIECNNAGVRFVEAVANCTLDEVNYLEDFATIPYNQLLPDDGYVDPDGREPLVQFQATQFACKGYVTSMIFNHSVADGVGIARFIIAVSEVARGGLDNISVKPVWNRNFFPSPSSHEDATSSSLSPPPITPRYNLVHAHIDMSMDHVTHLKKSFRRSTGKLCSSFEAVTAILRSARTRSIDLEHDTRVNLVFFAYCRQFVDPPLPNGFYGNCIFPVLISASSDWIKSATFIDVVKLIQQAKAELPGEFAKYLKGEHLKGGTKDPFVLPVDYNSLHVSEWGQLGYDLMDHGCGPPSHMVPVLGSYNHPVVVMGMQPLHRKGIRLTTWCVEEPHRQALLHHMKNID